MSAAADERYQAPYRARFDEAGPDGHLRSSAVLRYAQDLAWLHSAAAGFDRSWYGEHGLTWLVRAAELEVLAPIRVGAPLTGTTEVVGFRRVWSRRRSEFLDASGALCAWIHIDWVLLDARGAPTRIPPIFGERFTVPSTPLVLGRVALADIPDDAHRTRFTVRPQELDPMDHVNNAVYADWLDEAVIAAGDTEATRVIPRRIRLEFALPAARGATLGSTAWPDDAGWSYRVADSGGTELLRARLERAVTGG